MSKDIRMQFARSIIMAATAFQAQTMLAKPLDNAPEQIEQYGEIATQYNCQLPALWNSLKPEERVFAYCMVRASIPGNRIYADQLHRDAVEITELFKRIIATEDALAACTPYFDVPEFIAQAKTFAVYLFAHHNQYFAKEFEDHKRTPSRLNLSLLTPENIIKALEATGHSDALSTIARLYNSLFVASIEPTVTVEGNIEQSAGNMYSPDFTEADFAQLSQEDRSGINNYFYIEIINGTRMPRIMKYKIGGRYSQELQVAHYWLNQAREYALQHPAIFDAHIPTSLEHMLRYLISGDENDFKKFSIEWIKTNSRIDFNFGFIEVYQDPKQYRGSFEADVTIKAVDMQALNALLPSLEKQLPFPQEFKRENLDTGAAIPNATVNAKLFATGEAGPVKITAAYCLPNYSDIRAEHGSKQIIYQQGKGLAELINPELARNLFMSKDHAQWLAKHDPQGTLDNDIWDVHVLLHETLGHGSGKLATHTFVHGDPLTINGTAYAIGDTIAVTNENSNEFVGKYDSGLEELRAEIIALYTSIYNFDELAAQGMFKEWPQKIGKQKLIECFIAHMAGHGIKRLLVQKDDATEVVQAHAQANTTILNYLLDHGRLELIEETFMLNGVAHTVVDVHITDLAQAIEAVKALAIEVQRIKSTADGRALDALMKQYGACIRHPKYIKTLKANRQAVQGDLKEVAEIFPRLIPVYDAHGKIFDISAEWPATFLEQQLELSRQMLLTE